MRVSPELLGIVIRQGGLRFWWDRERVVYVREPHGQPVGRLEVGPPGLRPTLDEVHDVIDRYCADHGLSAGDWRS